jgi:hypothetical protein
MSSEARLVDTAFTTYQGPRAGRLAAIWSLAHWSALRALGARRGWKAKVIPISLTLLAFAPGLGQRQPQRRQRRPVLRLHQHDRDRGTGVQRRDHPGAGLPRPP